MCLLDRGKAAHGSLPSWVHDAETGNRYRVIDGGTGRRQLFLPPANLIVAGHGTYDYRPMDRQPAGAPGVIVGLRNQATTSQQATAAQTSGGFFVDHNPKSQPADK